MPTKECCRNCQHCDSGSAQTGPEIWCRMRQISVHAEIAPFVFPALSDMGPQEKAAAFAEEMANLSARCGLETRLRDVGIPQDALHLLARDAMNQTRLLVNNPRPLEETDVRAIYQAAW